MRQLIGTDINPDNERGIYCQELIFLCGFGHLGNFEHSSPLYPVLDFLKVGLNQIIGTDDVIICAGRGEDLNKIFGYRLPLVQPKMGNID